MKQRLYNHGLLYSINEKISPGKLKKISKFDNYDFEKIEMWLKTNHVNFIVDGDDSFHHKYLTIKPKPYIVYYQGNMALLNHKIVAIVGPRDMTSYAKEVLDHLFELLKGHDFVTISGLAEGVDEYCHKLSIENNIPTIAVLGGGLAHYLLSKRRLLINDIVENGGLIMSEFKLKMEPTNYSFPQRNRIVAGLADFVLVPEAGYKSGALITVDFANKMNIPVYGIPGSVFNEKSIGINHYIASNQITSLYDLKNFVGKHFGQKEKIIEKSEKFKDLNKNEKIIIDLIIENNNIDINVLIDKTNLELSDLMVLISGLEIKGIIKEISTGEYGLK